MVYISQTEDEIKIIIELNRVTARKPDIVLLPNYLKFNNPPIFFERHLAAEVDEEDSSCRIFRNEACIVLVKRKKGIWPQLFLHVPKDQLMRKRLEITDKITRLNQEAEQKAVERYEQKKRGEIEKEVRRETSMRERFTTFQKEACREALSENVIGKVASVDEQKPAEDVDDGGIKPTPARRAMAAVRSGGKIDVSFSNYTLRTPKRESQGDEPNPIFQALNLQPKVNRPQSNQRGALQKSLE